MRTMQILVVTLLCTFTVFGQSNKGAISGTVLDSNGAAVAGANVTVKNSGTGQSSTVTTTESGGFSISSLDPVTYSITVEVPNFKKAVVDSVKVDTASTATINVVLEAGAVAVV